MIQARARARARTRTEHDGQQVAVRDLSFDIAPGVVSGCLGPNGSGKSTTMRKIMGPYRPTPRTGLVGGKRHAPARRRPCPSRTSAARRWGSG